MPGPGPHLMYAMGSGLALTTLSGGRFSPHHTLFYTVNAFFGPDIGSFSEWLDSVFGFGFGSELADLVHDPIFYFLLLGLPLCFLYSWVSGVFLRRRVLDSFSGENGHSSEYTWILSTGWWEGRAPVNPDAVVVVGILCIILIGGFVYINRVRPHRYITKQSIQSAILIAIVALLYSLWCASQIFWVNPRRPAVGEEADYGVLVFLAKYFFLPHLLCILSMHPRDLEAEQIPP
ncbi:uncharacterized protein LOC125479566 isoform X2 [Pyrus x bretschneideri]|uniref:uncharacterized protein LOC125479566 isoform X2 n=1 Tax=Pyrus x bretschneideri TaxID=225117 RepID=UPI00202EB2EE|nr:uncharacterized protein LOC125479566 isoform X2 [Pyrus x bretschneideri]